MTTPVHCWFLQASQPNARLLGLLAIQNAARSKDGSIVFGNKKKEEMCIKLNLFPSGSRSLS
jgi:hypothetical protein